MWQPRKPGRVFLKFSICGFELGNFSTSSLAPAMSVDGWRMTCSRHGASSSHDRLMLRYQFRPPRKPVRVNSALGRFADRTELGLAQRHAQLELDVGLSRSAGLAV